MMNKSDKKCRYCDICLDRDEFGLNKKLFESDTKNNNFMCLVCMSDYLECTEEELQEKIEDFKIEGCKLFT